MSHCTIKTKLTKLLVLKPDGKRRARGGGVTLPNEFSLVIKMVVEYSKENRNILSSSNSKIDRSQPETRIPHSHKTTGAAIATVGPNVPRPTCLLSSSGSRTNFVADLNPNPNGQLCSDFSSRYPSSYTITISGTIISTGCWFQPTTVYWFTIVQWFLHQCVANPDHGAASRYPASHTIARPLLLHCSNAALFKCTGAAEN